MLEGTFYPELRYSIGLTPINVRFITQIIEIFKRTDLNSLKNCTKHYIFQPLLLFCRLNSVLLPSDCICSTAVIAVRRVLSRQPSRQPTPC